MPRFIRCLTKEGVCLPVELNEFHPGGDESTFLWADIDPKNEESLHTVLAEFSMDGALREAIQHAGQRPRFEIFDGKVFLSLRGVNFTNQDDPEDMVNLRIVFFDQVFLTFHTREMKTIETLSESVTKGQTFITPGLFLLQIVKTLNSLIASEIEELGDHVYELEENSLDSTVLNCQERLSEIRRSLIGYQKYLMPQARVLHNLSDVATPGLKKKELIALKNQAERVSSLVEELEHLKQRAAMLQDEIKSAHSEQMNQTMYRLTIISAIMLPLGLFAGLMGANVGGMPLGNDPLGFWIICGVSIGFAAGMYGLLKLMKWI